jgi:hypothetical protein
LFEFAAYKMALHRRGAENAEVSQRRINTLRNLCVLGVFAVRRYAMTV